MKIEKAKDQGLLTAVFYGSFYRIINKIVTNTCELKPLTGQ